MDTTQLIEAYGELGALGLLAMLLSLMINSLIKSQKHQDGELEQIREEMARMKEIATNTSSIVIKLVDRWNASDATRDRRHEKMVEEMNDLSDILMEIKGNLSRINGKH